ncbi:MAG TPA: SPFH domain-containing protein, partial [Rhodocyclaceae bacterium]|nr:SPFH domain-containing protein [Rhodocyclaceae bacterium]
MDSFDSLITTIILAAFALLVIKMVIVVVPQQSAFVIQRMGKYHETLQPGLGFMIPFIDVIAYRHSLKEVPMDVEPQICITRDNTQVQIDGILYYQITDPVKASYGTSDFEMAIEQLAKTTLRSEVGKRELDKLLEERADINGAVSSAIDEASPNWGVKVLRYEVKDITPPEAVLRAMQMQITAEREKRAKIAQSEGARQEEINLADGERQAAIAKSEGDQQASINRAKGEAAAILSIADASAEAIRKIADAIQAPGGDQAVSLKVAERYIEAFANLAKTNNTMIIPADLSNIASLITTAMAAAKASGS